MPANTHLKFFDITDFKAGEWTDDPAIGQGILMPNTGAQKLSDGYPMPTGGIRAFFTASAISVTGVDNIAQEVVTGIYNAVGYGRRTGAAGETGTVRYMTTWNETDNKARLYRMDGTNGATTWTRIFINSATGDNPADRRHTSFARFNKSDGTDYLVMILRSGKSSERGMYTIKYVGGSPPGAGDATVTLVSAAKVGPMTISQARVLVGGDDGTGLDGGKVYYSPTGDPTSMVATGSGSISPQPNINQPALRMIASQVPSEVLLGFSGGPWVVVSGDISNTSTPVRAMGEGHYPGGLLQDPIFTPRGIVFVEEGGAWYLTQGRNFTPLTLGLEPFDARGFSTRSGTDSVTAGFSSVGAGGFAAGFLFLPKSYVSFEETNGWFETSEHVSGMMCVTQGDARSNREGVMSASRSTNFTLYNRIVTRTSGTRTSAYTWRSAPLADAGGRQIAIREVQWEGQVYGTTTIAITITDHAGATTTQSVTGIAAGRRHVSIPINARGHYVDIQLVATNTAGGEAPTTDRLRIGMQSGHLL